MEIEIIEEYDGEFEEKKEELIKALFPNTRNMKTLNIPERDFRDKSFRELLDILEENYKDQLDLMWDEVEQKLTDWTSR